MSDKWGRGAVAVLDAEFVLGGTTTLVDSETTPTIDVINPQDVAVVTDDAPTRHPSTGRYEYDWDVPVDAPLGVWTARWSGTISGTPIVAEDEFEVVPAGGISFDEEYVVTVGELETYLREDFDATASVVALDIIDLTQGSLESWLDRPVTVRQFTETLEIDRLRESRLYLPYTPVVAVSALSIDDGPQLVGMTDYRLRSWGLDEFIRTGTVATITWEAGFDGRSREHSALRFAVLRAAGREMKHWIEQDGGLEEVRSEGYTAKFVAPDDVFTAAELGRCIRYKRKKIR